MMGLLFKHLAIRLWISLAAGCLMGLSFLPLLAGSWGPHWMIVPALTVLAIIFWLTGLGFATIGRRRLTRLLKEATVWERAGMVREARWSYERAGDVVDSFLFSPFSRRSPAKELLARMARFQLSQAVETPSEILIGAYLRHFPGDREAAVKWLEKVLAKGRLTHRSQDIAGRIGAAHPKDEIIQRMLAQFYLEERRCDFAALSTYRQLMAFGTPPARELLDGMTELFIGQPRTDLLALRVYLACWQGNSEDQRLRPAISACCQLIQNSPETRPFLEQADTVLAGIAPSERKQMAVAFMPRLADQRARGATAAGRPPALSITARIRSLLGHLARLFSGAAEQLQRLLSSAALRTVAKWGGLGILVVVVSWLVVSTARQMVADPTPPQQAPQTEPAVPADAFTLQAAAYLHEKDARNHVAQLKAKGVDAYTTRATSLDKTWYQVRISHYPTKTEARSVGDDLKARGLIGDYYIANYKRPDVP